MHKFDVTPLRRRPHQPSVLIAVAAGLVTIGISSAYVLYAYRERLPSFASVGEPALVPLGQPVKPEDFHALEQQIAGSTKSMEQTLAAQQTEIKRLSEQLTLLSGKVDLLQGPAASVDEPLFQQPVARAASRALRKKPAARNPKGGISVGGAPLPASAR